MLVTMGEGSGTPTKPYHTPSPEAQQTSPTTYLSPSLPLVATEPLPTVTPTDTPQLRQYTRKARIAWSLALPTTVDEPASPLGDGSQGEACPTVTGLVAGQDRETITKTSTLPSDLTPREDKEGGGIAQSKDDAPIKGMSLDEGEEAAKKGSDNTEEMVTVLTSLDAATVLSSGVAKVPNGSGSIFTARLPTTGVPTGKLPIERRIELISDLVKYQDHYAKVIKYQTQQRKPLSKKQQKEFYMSMLKSQAGWKARHFKGMTLKEIKEKFDLVWKQFQDFIPIGSKEEAKRFKRKGVRLEHDSFKKLKTSEEVPKEKLKEMMEMNLVEEVYVEALQVKHLIID
nr:hypothetical protein [Tanacetum cinerariifolium]GEZ22559.1 hypothetical protein [Tanacetum cinerariifolium]